MIALLWLLGCYDDLLDPGEQLGQDTGEEAVDPTEQAINRSSAAGDFAYDFITASPYDRLVIEVDYVVGMEPSEAALARLVATLEDLCHKPGGVELVVDDEIPPPGVAVWDHERISDLELQYRDRFRDVNEGTAVLYLIYVDGRSEHDTAYGRNFGIAYHGSSLAVFAASIDQAAATRPLGAAIEDAVLMHEAGHLLGLVGIIPMVEDHDAPSDMGPHDENPDCIMYYGIDVNRTPDELPGFDDACRADIRAAGGAG